MSAQAAVLAAVSLPLLGAVLIALCGRWPNLRESVTLATAAGQFALVAWLVPEVAAGLRPDVSLVEPLPGLAIAFRVEPLGLMFGLLASMLWIVTSIYSIGYMRGNREPRQTSYYAFFAIALSGAVGVAFSANLLTLFIFYEVLSLSTWPLVIHRQDDRARAGGRTYLGILLATSICLFLPAIIWTWLATGSVEFTPGGLMEGRVSDEVGGILLVLFVLGIGKAAVMPVHRWLPAAMVAPTPVSALLHAVAVVKAGVFSITKIVIYIFGVDFLGHVPLEKLMMYLAGFTVVAGSAIALRQVDIKRMLAYSTISQLSYVVMATLALSTFSEIGAAVHIVAHAFGKITLFFCAGAIYTAAHKTRVDQLRGIGHRMPWTMTAFAIGAVSMIGVPPTAGFVSKWYIIAGAFQLDNYFVLLVLMLSTGLNAAYFLPIVFRAFFRQEDRAPANDHREAPWPMVAALTFTALLTIGFFVFNGPLVELESTILAVPE